MTEKGYEEALYGWAVTSILSSVFVTMISFGQNFVDIPAFVYVIGIFLWLFSGLSYTFLLIMKGRIFP